MHPEGGMGRSIPAALGAIALLAACRGSGKSSSEIRQGDSFERELNPGEEHVYAVPLAAGESALVVVEQRGVDIVVEVLDPTGKTIASVDSPNGRQGDEPVLLEPEAGGTFTLRVRPIGADEPAARYELRYAWRRDAQATAAALHASQQWLARASAAIPPIPALDPWLKGVRVVGIGEATHGSRELGDLRLSLTQALVERYGFRVVAIEASADKYRALAPYVAGQSDEPLPSLPGPGWIWIGQRTQRELIEWVRAWNRAHKGEPVRIVGVDANDNAIARATLARFLADTYRGTEVEKAWPAAAKELAAADEQSFIFGDSGVDAATWKLLERLNTDRDSGAAPWRNARVEAEEALSILTEFAAFNAVGDIGEVPRSRDTYMARRVLRALQRDGASDKAVYWAHNAHVIHRKGSTRTAGGELRKELGLAYVAIATTFGEGGFLAEIPNDLEDDLAISNVPMAPAGTVESALALVRTGGSLALWRPDLAEAEIPLWFQVPRRMHWVGGLYRPDSNPSDAFQPYMVVSDFDGVAYVPRVAAEDVIAQPRIPARARAPR
ncbi:MAG TPA: erythromycin esterase family protein [Candidatus Polarisedimenticolaceae bacterium]|nr:erythromycin esterase family protein [Candidatus Polarisedimenticolaceae bacterium]